MFTWPLVKLELLFAQFFRCVSVKYLLIVFVSHLYSVLSKALSLICFISRCKSKKHSVYDLLTSWRLFMVQFPWKLFPSEERGDRFLFLSGWSLSWDESKGPHEASWWWWWCGWCLQSWLTWTPHSFHVAFKAHQTPTCYSSLACLHSDCLLSLILKPVTKEACVKLWTVTFRFLFI